MKRVLVTGAAGFVGGHLAAAGARLGWTVTAVDLRPVTLLGVDALEADAGSDAVVSRIAGGGFDVVLHQAAISDSLDDRRRALTEANVVLPLAFGARMRAQRHPIHVRIFGQRVRIGVSAPTGSRGGARERKLVRRSAERVRPFEATAGTADAAVRR